LKIVTKTSVSPIESISISKIFWSKTTMSASFPASRRRTGTIVVGRSVHSEKSRRLCSVCGEVQADTPGGPSCRNGHGGAPSLEPGRVPLEQRTVEATAVAAPAGSSGPAVPDVEDEPVIRSVSYGDLLD